MNTLNTQEAADVTRVGSRIYQIQDDASCESILPPKQGRGKPRDYGRHQLFLLALVGDLVRFGLPIPTAGRVVTRIAETLYLHPGAGALVVEFHEIGASFFYGAERHDVDLPCGEAAGAAGPVRFRLSFDLTAYRVAIDAALSAAAGRERLAA